MLYTTTAATTTTTITTTTTMYQEAINQTLSQRSDPTTPAVPTFTQKIIKLFNLLQVYSVGSSKSLVSRATAHTTSSASATTYSISFYFTNYNSAVRLLLKTSYVGKEK